MFSWIAFYTNGAGLSQYNEDGSENKYTDIEPDRLEKFALLDEQGEVRFILNIDPAKGQRLIYRIRTAQKMTGEKIRVFILGWQMNVSGQNIQQVAFITENGAVEITNGFREGHPWYYPVIFLPQEEV